MVTCSFLCLVFVQVPKARKRNTEEVKAKGFGCSCLAVTSDSCYWCLLVLGITFSCSVSVGTHCQVKSVVCKLRNASACGWLWNASSAAAGAAEVFHASQHWDVCFYPVTH